MSAVILILSPDPNSLKQLVTATISGLHDFEKAPGTDAEEPAKMDSTNFPEIYDFAKKYEEI